MVNAGPEPLVSPEVDCSDLDGFMLNVERLMASELVALGSHEEIAAALFLWCRAWKQSPAASLPDDDRVNAAFARLSLARFKKLKANVMRGFVKCSDGRLYHRFLAREAQAAFDRKEAFRRKRDADAERLRKWRGEKSERVDETHTETKSETRVSAKQKRDSSARETRFVAEGQGQGQGQGIIDNLPASQLTASARASSAELDLRKAIDVYAAYGAAIPPETGHAAVWLAQGYPPELCLSVVRSKMPGARDKGLRWFDKAIAEAASVKAPQPRRSEPPDDPNDPLVDLGGSKRRESEIRKHLAAWLDDKRKHSWNVIAFGFSPDDPGCRVPTGILAEFGLQRVPYPLDDEAAA